MQSMVDTQSQGCIQDLFLGGGGGDRICLQSRISDINLARLTIGGPGLASVQRI